MNFHVVLLRTSLNIIFLSSNLSIGFLGPEEDLPRKLDFMEFVCHAPSDYFRAHNAPYHTVSSHHNLCYVWTSIGSQVQPTPVFDDMFNVQPVPRTVGKVVKEKTVKDKQKEKEKTDATKVIKTEKDVSSV